MCFSAGASMGASVVLAGIGSASISRNTSPRLRLLAAMPLLFSAQQAAEAVVWLTMGDPASAAFHQLGVSAFLGFAFVVWPAYAPAALYAAERDPRRKDLLRVLALWGAVLAASAALLLARWDPVASVAGHSIRYAHIGSENSLLNGVLLFAYVVPTVTPFLVSSTTLARALGGAFTASLIVTVMVERQSLTSVWCFFAAILSGLILVAVYRDRGVRVLEQGSRGQST